MVEVDAHTTHHLRRRVLRAGDPASDVRFPEDHSPGAFHLAVADDHEVVAVASFSFQPHPLLAAARSVHLRGMAVDERSRGSGAGRMLLDHAVERLRGQGVEVLWANGRDGALGFYVRLGWSVVGEGFVMDGVPHHLVMIEL